MNKIINWYFPFILSAIVICATQLFPLIFNPSTRWLFVLSAFMFALRSPYSRPAIKTPVFLLMILYLFWCLITVRWSEIPKLSFYKVMAAALVLPGMFSLGFAWTISRKYIQNIFNLFNLFVPVVLIVAVSGKAGQGLMDMDIGTNYYAGLAGNSNFLGWLMAISLPFLLWKILDHRLSQRHKWYFFLIAGICGYYLLLSQSRSAMILTFCPIFGFFVSTAANKRIKMIGFAIFLIINAIFLVPNLSDLVYSKFILKGSGNDLAYAIERSRGQRFRESLQAAEEGGLFGAGYGISIGRSRSGYHGGLTSVRYGREKICSPLAIVEETGVIGLVLLVLVISGVFITAFRAYRLCANRESRALMGMFIGFLFGMILHSNLEAWFVAPGSVESIFFWSVSGIVYSMSLIIIANAQEAVRCKWIQLSAFTGNQHV